MEQASTLPAGVLVLCGVLLAWRPLAFASSAARALSALPVRGTPVALVLVLNLLVTAAGVSAGILLLGRRRAAIPFAATALALAALADVFVELTPYFPSNRMPGDAPLYAAASAVFHAAWIAYLLRSRRVRDALTS
jgi:hypothetical protein